MAPALSTILRLAASPPNSPRLSLAPTHGSHSDVDVSAASLTPPTPAGRHAQAKKGLPSQEKMDMFASVVAARVAKRMHDLGEQQQPPPLLLNNYASDDFDAEKPEV